MTMEDIVAMARAAQRDDRLADGALYGKLADEIEKLRHALTVLLDEAMGFSVSGVYFDEECMGHKGPELARKALYP
jgi:hypothetical protein